MTGRLSPDGLYVWDGERWQSTLSRDGQHRWDGEHWQSVNAGGLEGATYKTVPGAARQPTSWTRPIQIAIVAVYAVEILWAAGQAFWYVPAMSKMMQAIATAGPVPGQGAPAPPTFLLAAPMYFGIGLTIVLAIGVIVLAVKRWTWAFYAVLAIVSFHALTAGLASLVPLSLALFAPNGISMGDVPPGGEPPVPRPPDGFPTWMFAAPDVFFGMACIALLVWMMVALVKRGPWAMRKVAPS